MYAVGEPAVPLCLDCWAKHNQVVEAQNAMHERMLNYLSDEMDAIAGLPPIGPRFPERKPPVVVGHATFHNINVKDSNVGVINSGYLHQVDTAVSVIGKQGDASLAFALKLLTETVVAHKSIQAADKKEIIELLSALSSEASQSKEQRRVSVARPLLTRLRELLSASADVATVAQPLIPYIAAAFGLS